MDETRRRASAGRGWMARLGLDNIYLKVGLPLLVIGMVCGGVLFLGGPHGSPIQMRLAWGMTGCLCAGLVLYVTGRIAQVLRARSP